MTDTTNTDNGDRSKRWWLIAAAIVVLVGLIAALALVTGGNDSQSSATTDVATTAAAAATTDVTSRTTDVATTQAPGTTEPVTTEPGTTLAPADAAKSAIWPWVDSPTRFSDPVAAATSFAVDYIGFTDPIMGEFQAGDSRSGEVEVRATETGPVTVVFVRQLTADDTWWVLGCAATNITIDQPAQAAVVTSPLTISGTASAFEGTVDVTLRADGNGEPVYAGFVTGSGDATPGPYEATIDFTSPGPSGGALVMISRSPQDNSPVVEASALRIYFG
jgi:hypothetical protein